MNPDGAGKEKGTCNSATKVCLALTEDATGAPTHECVAPTDGAAVVMNPAATEHGAYICGPGTFTFSPMQCAGDKFDYKAKNFEIKSSEWSGGSCPGAGQKIEFPYTMACYKVDCRRSSSPTPW